MFVSEEMKMYPCSFMAKDHKGIPIETDNMQAYWQNGKAFKQIRNAFNPSSCSNCIQTSLCLGGCPIWPSINLCPKPAQR
jgi:radical SAM protein with 4Fe4S-binding SPASM domain